MTRSRTASLSRAVHLSTAKTSVTVRNLKQGTRYYFRVRAVGRTGAPLSAQSSRTSVLTRQSTTSTTGTGSTSGTGTTAPAPTRPPLPTPIATGPVDVRVGSYNVLSVSLDKNARGEQKTWRERRGAVLAGILGQGVDVLGVQEANQSRQFAPQLVDGENQFLDIKNGLNKRGASFALTNEYANNCAVAWRSSDCTYVNRGSATDNRILYNTRTISLVSQGAHYYRAQISGAKRSLAYAVLQVNSTGARFLFVDTHLESGGTNTGVRERQWNELVAKISELRQGLPVVTVGDFNTQKFDPVACRMLPAMKGAGFGDVLNQQCNTNPTPQPRARHTVNAWINSMNRMTHDVRQFSYSTRHDKTGNSIDWIFASNELAVPEYQLVLDYDPATMQVNGVMPSDHNMVRATVTLP